MNLKPKTMRWVAFDLLIGVAVLFLVLWISPWDSGQPAGGGSAVAVKYDKAQATKGEALSTQNGCTGCHSTTGGAGAAPTWKGLYGSTGATLNKKVDDAYIAEILKNPPPAMASFKGKFDEQQVTEITEYIKSLAN
jgi:cytochrome c553